MSRGVFIHHDGALGDVLLSIPAIRAIRRQHGPVHLAGRPDIVRLLRAAGEVDDASSSDSRVYASLHADRADAGAQRLLEGFGRAYVFSVRPYPPLAAAMGRIIPRTSVILTIPPEGERTHVAEYRLGQVGGGDEDRRFPFLIPSPGREKAHSLLREAGHDAGMPLIAVHPGSGGKAKCWPQENYFGLIERLRREGGAFIVLLAGPAEDPSLKERIMRSCRTRTKMLPVADEDLMTVAALLRTCGLFIGNDSGVSHLAAAVGCPVIAVFGPTDPALWGPVGEKVRIVAPRNGDGMSSLAIEEVLAVVHEA